jgi:hypothetical protein
MGLLSRGSQVRVLPGALPRETRKRRPPVVGKRRDSLSLVASGSESCRARHFQNVTEFELDG